jgi:D-aminoacyl-tRNA deacylase
MRIVLQRVKRAQVKVENNIVGQINAGLVVLVGVAADDTDSDIDWLATKLIQMRIFNDSDGKMNRSIIEVNGDLLVVSQFTLFASTKKGNRPSFTKSAPPEMGKSQYEAFVLKCASLLNKKIETGIFGAHMEIELVNDGPVTISIDTKSKE